MKYIIAVGMTLLSIFVWFNLLTSPDRTKEQYRKAIESARDYEERQIYQKAVDYYEQARSYANEKQDYSIGMKLVELSVDLNDAATYEKECNALIKKYPDRQEPYEKLLEYYQARKDLTKLVPFLLKAQKKFPKEEVFVKAYQDLETDYTDLEDVYKDISDWFGGYALVKTTGTRQQEESFLASEEEKDSTDVPKSETMFQVLGKQGAVEVDELYCDQAVLSDQPGQYLLQRNSEKQWNMTDSNGNVIENNPDVAFEEIGPFVGGYASAKAEGKYYWINETMHTSRKSFEKAGSFWDGCAPVCNDGKWALFSAEEFKEITKYCFSDIKQDEFGRAVIEDRMFAAQDGGYGLYNGAGKKVEEESFEDAKPFLSKEPAAVKQNGKWGFADRAGKVVIEASYEDAGSFAHGYAAVCQNGKWGVINRKGEMVVQPQYGQIKSFNSEGLAAVKSGSDWHFIRINTIAYQ